MHTFLKEAFTSCIQVDTHATDAGLKISVAKKKDEIVLFVKTDNDNARRNLQMPEDDDQSCDRLILYAKQNNNKNELICFLELKGKDLGHAVDQIINTHKYIFNLINRDIDKKHITILRICACICMHNSISATREQDLQLEKLKKCLKTDKIKIKHGIKGPYDIGYFLRESYV
jgi:hypothetical protein